ncbi:hypothetical protein [Microbacterium sp.]|uniref:hypothetical protein n=1 Tax=Microbacterium sp. TaxID=51671 RepID=UPI003C7135E4
MIGDLLGEVRALRQVLDQLAAAHLTAQRRVHDDFGNPDAGAASALAAADELHQAVRVHEAVDRRQARQQDEAAGHVQYSEASVAR